MNTVIYTRVSTKEQAENNKSLDMQKDACKDYAAHKNIDVVKIFIEQGESAKTADRTELQKMLRYCADRKNKVQNVIVWKLDRLARKTEDHLALTSMFAKYGARLHSATEPIEDTPSGKLMEHILASFAEFDNSVRAERSQKGMENRLKEGCWVHHSPLGFKNVKNILKQPTLEPDENASKVARLLNDFSKGLHTQKHMAQLARSKYRIKTRKGNYISDNGVYKMLRNPVYAGMVYGKSLPEPIKGVHDGIISYETYLKNQAIIEGRNPPKAPKQPDKTGRWSLRRFLKCAYCKNGLTGSTPKGRSAFYAYYHCTKCKGVQINKGTRKGQSKHLYINQEDTHKAFKKLLGSFEPPVEVLKLFREVTLRKWNQEFRESIQAKDTKERELNELVFIKTQYTDKFALDKIDEEDYNSKLEEIMAKRHEIELELLELNTVFDNKEEIVDKAVYFIQNANKLWGVAMSANRSRFQRMVIPDGISVNEHLQFGTADLGPVFQELSLLRTEYEKTKKTQKDTESLMVIPTRIELVFLD